MKFGQRFERESVPQWSLRRSNSSRIPNALGVADDALRHTPDNIDYNSLKHYIKVHTTKDQATAIAIPSGPNTALSKFEHDFYAELCRQHSRVDLFVSSKAGEIERRLRTF